MKPLSKLWHDAADTLLAAPFAAVLCTVFAVSRNLANGAVSGKYFWFYLSLALISVAVIISFAANRKKIAFSVTDALTGLFCISGLIITSLRGDGVSVNKSVLLLLVLILYFYFRIFAAQRKRNMFILSTVFILTGFVEAVWGLRQLYGFTSSQHSLFRTTGSFFNPGPYAGYLAMIMPLAFYSLLNDYRIFKSRFRYIYIPFYIRWSISLLSFSSILTVLPSTMSRAAWIAATAGCLVTGILYLIRSRKLKTYVRRFRKRIPLILSGAVVLLAIGITGIYRLKKDSADGRVLIWKTSLQVIAEHPLGTGLGRFPGVYGEKQAAYFAAGRGSEQEQAVAGGPEYAFNEYVQICVEFGIIPLLVFVSAMICALYTAVRKRGYAPVGALASLLIFASMSYPFGILPFAVSLAFLVALCLQNSPGVNYHRYSSGKSAIIIFFILTLQLITIISIRNRYPLYEAYRSWKKTKILYDAGLYEDVNRVYAGIHPCLSHEIRFLFEQAQSLSRSGRYEESNRVLEKAVKISCDPMLYNIMGKNCQALGQYAAAEGYFNKAALIVPNRLYPCYLLARLYDETGDGVGVCRMAELVRTKEAKVHSAAVDEMRDEMKLMCEKYKSE
jgi:O-antigen ligase